MVLKMSRTRCCCAYGGASSEHDMGSCTVTRQHGDDEETCVMYQAEHAPQGTCKSVIEALLWPTTYTKKIPILFGCETSVECMAACRVAPWSTMQVSGKNKLVGRGRSARRSLGPTLSPTLWSKPRVSMGGPKNVDDISWNRASTALLCSGHEGLCRCQETWHNCHNSGQNSFIEGGRRKLSRIAYPSEVHEQALGMERMV